MDLSSHSNDVNNDQQMASAYATIKDHREFFGHPIGLFVLFFTEMWERFSYYGMRALLVLYMTKSLIVRQQAGTYVFGFDTLRHVLESAFGPLAVQPFSSQIYGFYTGFVFFTPIIGGWIADRFFGQRRTVILGGILMAIGHFLMAVESLFLPALLFLILGNGCFKPNVSTQVGSLYKAGDPRRDRAFNIFYMGVNLGAFFSPLVCGTLGQVYGWHYGFGAAGVGMVVGLIIYLWGQKFLAEDNLTRREEAHVEVQKLTPTEWKAIWGLVILCALNVVFWAVYEQQGNTIQLFADQNTDWHILGWNMPTTWFQSMNPAFIFILTPFISMLWKRQAERKTEPSSIVKMGLGCVMLGLSFLVLVYVSIGLTEKTLINCSWLVGCTLIYTLGELYLSPVGLSLVTKVAPAKYVGMLMGMWFLSSFFGNILSGYIGTFYSSMSKESFFLLLTGLGVTSGLGFFATYRPLRRALGHDV